MNIHDFLVYHALIGSLSFKTLKWGVIQFIKYDLPLERVPEWVNKSRPLDGLHSILKCFSIQYN